MKDKELRKTLERMDLIIDGGFTLGPGKLILAIENCKKPEKPIKIKTGRKVKETRPYTRLEWEKDETIDFTVAEAMQMLINHFNLQLDYEPASPEKINGLKKVRAKK